MAAFTIREVSRRSGLSEPTLRYYEDVGLIGPIFAIDQPSSSTHTREALSWEPTHPSLLEDLDCIQP